MSTKKVFIDGKNWCKIQVKVRMNWTNTSPKDLKSSTRITSSGDTSCRTDMRSESIFKEVTEQNPLPNEKPIKESGKTSLRKSSRKLLTS